MKITTQTGTKLVFQSGVSWLSGFECDLDRDTGRARITRTEFFIRRKPVDVALADIASAKAWSQDTKQKTADTVGLVLKSGECVPLPMPSYGKAGPFNDVATLINGFLAG